MIGFSALILAFIFTIISAFTYGLDHFQRKTEGRPDRKSGRIYNVSAALIAVAALFLFYLILTDKFQYQYVYAYSARDLNLFYKAAAFWAGQEGSLLLWAAMHALFGVLLKRGKSFQPAVMAVYGLLQACLLAMVLIRSPFMILTGLPADGAGLNPLLQNPWMVTHPPVLFLGYAGLAVPFALAMGSLFTSDYKSWIKTALPWTLFAWAALGVGIFMGGYWAYEVLGWGGYWAWDPVENSSLIPWLITGSLAHFLIVGARRPLAVKPAYIAAVFAYSAALYGTFLTRSGILSDFSTHSFAATGIGGALAALVMLVLSAALILLIVKWPALPVAQPEEPVRNRAFITVTGGVALSALAAVILFGTSSPLITVLQGNPQSVSPAFFNTTSLPLAACVLALITLASLFTWSKQDDPIPSRWIVLTLAGLLAAALAVAYNIREFMCALVLGLAGAAFMASAAGLKRGLSKPAALTHAGFSCLVIGIIISSAASKTEIAAFQEGQRHDFFGRAFVYAGEETLADDGGYIQKFTMDGQEMNALTRFDKAGKYSVHEPAIHRSLTEDIYLAPSLTHSGVDGSHELVMEQPARVGAEGLEMTLTGYGMTDDDPDATGVYATVDFSDGEETETVRVELAQADGGFQAVPVTVLGRYEAKLMAVSVSENKVLLDIHNTGEQPEQVLVEISRKPLINLVWLGTVVIAAGTMWAAARRRGKNE